MIRNLYKYSKLDKKTIHWKLELDGRRYRISVGFLGEKLEVGGWKVCTIQRKTKVSTHEQQAMLEAIEKVQRKIKQGFRSEINEI